MKMFYRISAYSLALGLVHTALTPLFYDRLSTQALWFAGTGLALVFLGLLNLAAERVRKAWLLTICIAANSVMTIFCILIVLVLPEIQAYLGLLFILTVTVASIGYRRLITTTTSPSFSSSQ